MSRPVRATFLASTQARSVHNTRSVRCVCVMLMRLPLAAPAPTVSQDVAQGAARAQQEQEEGRRACGPNLSPVVCSSWHGLSSLIDCALRAGQLQQISFGLPGSTCSVHSSRKNTGCSAKTFATVEEPNIRVSPDEHEKEIFGRRIVTSHRSRNPKAIQKKFAICSYQMVCAQDCHSHLVHPPFCASPCLHAATPGVKARPTSPTGTQLTCAFLGCVRNPQPRLSNVNLQHFFTGCTLRCGTLHQCLSAHLAD